MKKIEQLRQHLIKYGSITKMEASDLYRLYGVKEYVNRLNAKGMVIVTDMIEQANGHPYARYCLRGME